MKVTSHSNVPVYTIAGSSTARPLPEWLARKRKRSLKNDVEYTNRIELLQDFEFEEASSCIRVSDDGQWIMSTGTYKPQIHTHYLPHLSLSFARHTTSLNQTFLLLSSDYSKSLHLQSDRTLEFHTPQGCHYSTRIPRYGRDLKYVKRSTEALIPAVGWSEDGSGEVFRLNLESGRFMRGYAVDIGDDTTQLVPKGVNPSTANTESVNVADVAESSHDLLAFGTSIGTVEFWDGRSASRVGVLAGKTPVTALKFEDDGLGVAVGDSEGVVQLFDLRSPRPLLRKEQGYGYPIQTFEFLSNPASEKKILSADKRIIKIWDQDTGKPWTSVEPAVDINCVARCKDSGMILTANEGKEQHAFFVPQLGPAPRWCSFLDNLVEEMAEDSNDPQAYRAGGAVYDNYKFLTPQELEVLNLDHLIGTTNLLRPYMHGYFVAQKLYEEARLIADPFILEEQRAKKVKETIDKVRESRIRGSKNMANVKVNKKLAEKITSKQKKSEKESQGELLEDSRFTKLFQDEEFAVDEHSREFASINPSTKPTPDIVRRKTAVEEEDEDDPHKRAESTDEEDDENDDIGKDGPEELDSQRISSTSYRKSGHKPQLQVTSSQQKRPRKDRTFGSRKKEPGRRDSRRENVLGDRQITFAPERRKKPEPGMPSKEGKKSWKGRRSASGNTFRNM